MRKILITEIVLAMVLAACATDPNDPNAQAKQKAAAGAALGAIAGAIIGYQGDHSGGALKGALIGGAGGAALGPSLPSYLTDFLISNEFKLMGARRWHYVCVIVGLA